MEVPGAAAESSLWRLFRKKSSSETGFRAFLSERFHNQRSGLKPCARETNFLLNAQISRLDCFTSLRN